MKAKQKAIKKKAPPPPASTRRRPISKPVSKVKKPAGKYGAIREGLRRQRMALLKEAGVILTKDPDGATSSDVTDQAQAEVERNFILRLKEREQRLLQKIDEAVERIDEVVKKRLASMDVGGLQVHTTGSAGIGRDLISEIWELDLRTESSSIGACGCDGSPA